MLSPSEGIFKVFCKVFLCVTWDALLPWLLRNDEFPLNKVQFANEQR